MQTQSQIRAAIHPFEHVIKVLHDRRFGPGQISVRRNVLFRVSLNAGSIQNRIFLKSDFAEHNAQQTLERDHAAANNVGRVHVTHLARQIERVDFAFRIQRNIHVSAAHRITQILVFALRIDNDHVRPHHQTAQHFQFDRITFACAGRGEHARVGILQGKAIKQNQTVVVPIDPEQDSLIGRQFGRNKRKRRGDGRRIKVRADQELVITQR